MRFSAIKSSSRFRFRLSWASRNLTITEADSGGLTGGGEGDELCRPVGEAREGPPVVRVTEGARCPLGGRWVDGPAMVGAGGGGSAGERVRMFWGV